MNPNDACIALPQSAVNAVLSLTEPTTNWWLITACILLAIIVIAELADLAFAVWRDWY